MAIHIQETSQLQQGHLKTIDESGIMMIFDTLQKYQYSYPIKSTVRELLSNGVDSISEKKVAKQILSGTAKVEDFFVEIEGDLYKDSKFDPTYYDLKWLSNDDTVSMQYIVGPPMEKDRVVFTDYGVGLAGKRLEGYFKLAYSTKRLSKLPLGKFGLGAKSPLSVGVDFYTVESRYNGRLFRFNVYSSKVDSIIPKMNMETGKENPFVLFNEGTDHEYPVHYLSTEEKNGLTITLEAKKHHLQQYVDAVKSQMLYFDDIAVSIKHITGVVEHINYKANVLYEDDLIVMSDNNYYSKPHLLLNRVNYGYIAWDELELEEKTGNIGIKVAPEDIEVNPSRESVLWTEKTKNKVLMRFNEVVDIAAGMIQEELKSTDFLQWLKTCYSVYNKYSERGGVVGRLSKIVDLSKAKFKFNPDERIVFDSSDPTNGLFMRHVTIKIERDADKVVKHKVNREEVSGLGSRLELPIYLMSLDERSSNRRDKWLFKQHPGGFLTIQEPYATIEQAEAANASEHMIKRMYKSKMEDRMVYWEAIKASDGVLWYKDIEVPEEATETEEEVSIEVEEGMTTEEVKQIELVRITAEERRKQQGKTLAYLPMATQGTRSMGPAGQVVQRAYEFCKVDIPIADINNWGSRYKEVYYGADDELIQFISIITRDPAHDNTLGRPVRKHARDKDTWLKMKWWRLNKHLLGIYNILPANAYYFQHFFDTDIAVIKTSRANFKHYRDFSRLEEFFFRIQNQTITMSNQLIKWNTARLIRSELSELSFLYNFPFSPEYSDAYQALCKYVDKHYREVELYNSTHYGLSGTTYSDMITHLDNVHNFQKFVATNPNDKEGIGTLANKMFGNPQLTNGMAVDPEIMNSLAELKDFAHSCGTMLNFIPVLTGYPGTAIGIQQYNPGVTRQKLSIPEDLERELRDYLEKRGVFGSVSQNEPLHLQEVMA